MALDVSSCEALPGWTAAANNGWTGAGTASDYAAFAGVAAGLTLAVLVVALQQPFPESESEHREYQSLREQTMAVGIATVLLLIGASFLYAQATGESTCAAISIDNTLVGVPLGAGVVGMFVLAAFISDLLHLGGVAARVVGWSVLSIATLAMLLNIWSTTYLVSVFRSDHHWTSDGGPLAAGVLCVLVYGYLYRRSVNSRVSRDRPVIALAVANLAVLLAAVVQYAALSSFDFQEEPASFPIWVGAGIGLTSMVHGGIAIIAAPLALGLQKVARNVTDSPPTEATEKWPEDATDGQGEVSTDGTTPSDPI